MIPGYRDQIFSKGMCFVVFQLSLSPLPFFESLNFHCPPSPHSTPLHFCLPSSSCYRLDHHEIFMQCNFIPLCCFFFLTCTTLSRNTALFLLWDSPPFPPVLLFHLQLQYVKKKGFFPTRSADSLRKHYRLQAFPPRSLTASEEAV